MEKYQFPKIKNEIQFEDFTRDLLNLIHATTSFQLYGRKGQSQNGLDGYSTLHNIFFQCKHKSSQYIKDTKLEEELVDEFDKAKNKILELSNNTISKFLFFTTHPNTTKLQDKARLLSNDEIIVEYWGWESIESYLNDFYLFENKDFYKKYYPKLASGLSSSIPPQLTIKSSTHDKNFIGREDEVKYIDTMLKKPDSLLLINGIRGIGKSSLANHYLYIRENEFDYYGFIEGLDSFISEFRNSLDLKNKEEEELYREIIFKLQKLKGNKLLVIDNVEDIASHKELISMILSLHKHDYKILFTSRRKIKNVTAYPLGTLAVKKARELFLSYFKTDELERVDKIIDYLGLHTLFIKLVAETIENEGYSLDDILKKFEDKNGGLSKIKFTNTESGEELTFNQNLQELFPMQHLEDKYILLLKRLAVLPSIDIGLSFLEEILGKERLKGRLNFLVGRGWLIENDGSYKLHQIIKEFLLVNYTPSLEDIEEVFVYFFKLIENSSINSTVILNRDKLMFFESIYRILKDHNTFIEIAIFYMNLGNIYRGLSSYKKALLFGKLSIKILKSIIKENTYNKEELKGILILKSTAYNNLSQTYYALTSYKRTYILDKKVLNLRKEILGNNHIYTIQSWHNLAQLASSCGKNKEAKKLFEEAINLIREVLNIENLNIFISEKTYLYSNYASFLLRTEPKNKLSLEFANEAVDIYKKEYENSDAHLATLYHNLINIQEHFGEELNRVIESRENVLQLKINSFGEEHEDVATAYTELAVAYARNNNCKVACNYINRALIIYVKIFKKENHPRITDCNDRLNYIKSICKKDKKCPTNPHTP